MLLSPLVQDMHGLSKTVGEINASQSTLLDLYTFNWFGKAFLAVSCVYLHVHTNYYIRLIYYYPDVKPQQVTITHAHGETFGKEQAPNSC